MLIGFLTSDNPEIDYFHLKGSGATTRALGVGDRAALVDMVCASDADGLKPVVDRTLAFAEARHAFYLRDGRHVYKIVVAFNA